MPPWIIAWISLLIADGKLRKATDSDYRLWFGHLALTPIGIGLAVAFGDKVMNHGSTPMIWVYLVVVGLMFYFGTVLWGKLVPSKISLIVAICTWAVAFWLAWHHFL